MTILVGALLAVTALVSLWQLLGPHSASAKPTWEERFEDPSLVKWSQVLRATPDRLRLVENPTRDGGQAARFTVADDDVAPRTPTENPRAQLNSRLQFKEGDDVYVGWSTYLPRSFPSNIDPWFVFFQFHSPPYDGSPRFSLGVHDGRLGLDRDERYGFDRPWSTNVLKGTWMDFVVHVKWSADPRRGFVDLWMDGKRQTFSGGGQRLKMATLKSRGARVEIIPTNYRKRGSFGGSVTVFHDDIAVGKKYDAVDR